MGDVMTVLAQNGATIRVVVLGLGGGVLLGLIYFTALRATAHLIVSGRQPILALALIFGRLAFLAAIFFAALYYGAAGLLATAAGVLIGRGIVMRHARKARP